jgi:hypothetical protein
MGIISEKVREWVKFLGNLCNKIEFVNIKTFLRRLRAEALPLKGRKDILPYVCPKG